MQDINLFNSISLLISLLTLCGFGVVAKHFWDDKHEKRKAQSLEEKNRIKKENQDELREVISDEVKDIKTGIAEIDKKINYNTEGTVTLLRDRMQYLLRTCKQKGYATPEEKANWHDLFNSYKNLGGNHFREYVNQWLSEIDNMPSESSKK